MYFKHYETWPIPEDHYRQVQASTCAQEILKVKKCDRVMDLGCGEGNSIDLFRSMDSDTDWFGLDIATSPEVAQRTRNDANFYTFDGISIPFEEDFFDLIYSSQSLEHVKHPQKLLAEVKRVLKPGGYFVGSTSQLEPYHSFSTWNYTIYGFQCLMEEIGLELQEVRPGIDSVTLIIRRGLGCPAFFSRWWKRESPLNKVINLWGQLSKKSVREVNIMKLLFCGQFCFIAQKLD